MSVGKIVIDRDALELICSQIHVKCDYIWNDEQMERLKYPDRSSNIYLQGENVNVVARKESLCPMKQMSGFNVSFNQKEILAAAKKIFLPQHLSI